MIKNTAGQKWVVVAIDLLERIPMLGDAANLSATISKDGGNYTAIANPTFTELGEGRYVFTLSQAETNCDRFHILPQSSTSAVHVANEETCYTTVVRAAAVSDVAAIKAKTDQLTFSVANQVDANAAAVASAVRTNLAVELGRIDVAVSSRVGEIGAILRATQADDGTLVLFEGDTYNGTAHDKISFVVAKDYTLADGLVLSIWRGSDPTVSLLSVPASVASTTLVEVPTLTASFTGLTYGGNPPVAELRYSLLADWAGELETVASGRVFVYETPPLA
jgi:hypothetical protein